MKKSVPWNLIIPKLKQEISADEERQLETWLRSSNNEALFKELQLLWEKIQANVENYTPNTEYYWNELVNRMHASEPKQTEKPAKKRFELKRIYRYAVAACIAVAIGCSFYIGFLNGQPEAMPQLYSNLSGKSKVLLPDGSEVWMLYRTRTPISHRGARPATAESRFHCPARHTRRSVIPESRHRTACQGGTQRSRHACSGRRAHG